MIRLAILGTGGMAQRHAEEFQKIEGVELVACADIHLPVAQKFAKKNNIPQIFSSLEGLLAFAEFDAVANVTPDRFHCATTLPQADLWQARSLKNPLLRIMPTP